MMKKLLTVAILSAISTTAVAVEQCDGGYWRTITEEICDTRTAYIDEAKTRCEYSAQLYRDDSLEYVRPTYMGHIQCASSLSVTFDAEGTLYERNMNERGEYTMNWRLSGQDHFLEQRQITEQFNCRIEERQVWVDGGRNGDDCNENGRP